MGARKRDIWKRNANSCQDLFAGGVSGEDLTVSAEDQKSLIPSSILPHRGSIDRPPFWDEFYPVEHQLQATKHGKKWAEETFSVKLGYSQSPPETPGLRSPKSRRLQNHTLTAFPVPELPFSGYEPHLSLMRDVGPAEFPLTFFGISGFTKPAANLESGYKVQHRLVKLRKVKPWSERKNFTSRATLSHSATAKKGVDCSLLHRRRMGKRLSQKTEEEKMDFFEKLGMSRATVKWIFEGYRSPRVRGIGKGNKFHCPVKEELLFFLVKREMLKKLDLFSDSHVLELYKESFVEAGSMSRGQPRRFFERNRDRLYSFLKEAKNLYGSRVA